MIEAQFMLGGGGVDDLASGGGEDDEGSASVLGALFAGHEATFGHPGDLVGQAALLPVHRFGQVLEPLPTIRGVGERDEDL